MPDYLVQEAIQIAKENKESFGPQLLKRKLHIGLVSCNLLIDRLLEMGVIESDSYSI